MFWVFIRRALAVGSSGKPVSDFQSDIISNRASDVTLVKTYFSFIIVFIFFLFLHGNICCGYSLEVPHRGTSNEYPQHMLPWRNKKTVYVATPLF